MDPECFPAFRCPTVAFESFEANKRFLRVLCTFIVSYDSFRGLRMYTKTFNGKIGHLVDTSQFGAKKEHGRTISTEVKVHQTPDRGYHDDSTCR